MTKTKMKTIHITETQHELLYNIKRPWQSYGEIIEELIEMQIAIRIKEYQEKYGTELTEDIKSGEK